MEFRVDALLERYRKIFSDRSSERLRVVEIVHQTIGVTLSEKDIAIDRGVLSLSIKSAAIRNELYLRKEPLLQALKGAGFKIGEIRM